MSNPPSLCLLLTFRHELVDLVLYPLEGVELAHVQQTVDVLVRDHAGDLVDVLPADTRPTLQPGQLYISNMISAETQDSADLSASLCVFSFLSYNSHRAKTESNLEKRKLN